MRFWIAAWTIIGLAGARGGSRLLSAFMSAVSRTAGTSTSDQVLLVGAPLLLAALALAACAMCRPADRCASTRLWRCARNNVQALGTVERKGKMLPCDEWGDDPSELPSGIV